MTDALTLTPNLAKPDDSYALLLAAHEGLRHTPRVRKVWNMLAQGLGGIVT